MSDGPLVDRDDRLVVREALDETIIVEAAAGTGKTTELVTRILNVLASGRARIEQVVAVTFTEKAAGELKLRIRKELEHLRQRATDPVVVGRLADAIQHLEEAHVSTIHGFCADLLRERPIEASVDPLFEVLTEGRADRIYDEAFRTWLADHLEAPPAGVRRALRRSVWSRDGRDRDDGPIDRLAKAGRELAEWRDYTTPWRRDSFDREQELEQVIARIHELATLTEGASSTRDPLFLDTGAVRELSHDIQAARRLDADDLDGWEARIVDLAQNRTFRQARVIRGRMYGRDLERDRVWRAFETTKIAVERFQQAADADLAALLRGELAEVTRRYEDLKRRAGALDFIDLLLRARDLLVGNAGVRRAFQMRFTHLFVDEFQDTDPLQAEVVLLLAADDPDEHDWRHITPVPGKLFIVGDPKQAIYRFRRADIETYREVCELLVSRGASRVYLHTSFRSLPAIQRVVNAAFGPVMTGDRDTLQADYVSLSAFRSESDQPAVVALPVPEPYGRRQIAAYAIEASQPDGVGAFVDWLLSASGWVVTERTLVDELPLSVPVQPRHVCILFRRFLQFGQDVTRRYVEALEARGIPHVLVGGKSFHDREEVETIRASLAAVEWPDDELSVFATLRGALFAIGDELLLEYRHKHGRFHPFQVPARVSTELQPIADALALLRTLHSRRNHLPVADTLTRLLEATRAHVGFVLRTAGEQALANVLHVAELARRHEVNGGISFRGFVEELRAQADGGQAAEAPILEEGSQGVRLMTVHKAKGLEFPVVILADMTAKLRSEHADRLIDRQANACFLRLGRWTPVELAAQEAREVARDKAEGVRIAYVAATRARDLLVVPVVGDAEREGGWTSPLNAAVYPRAEKRAPLVALGCPTFTKDSVYSRPDGDPASATTVSPGLHIMSTSVDPYPVVWWDPHALTLKVEPAPGIRRESLIAKDVPASVVNDGLAAYERWRRAREAATAQGAIPSLSVRTVTEWAASASVTEQMPDQRDAPLQRGLFDDSGSPPAQPAQRPPTGAGGAFDRVIEEAVATVTLVDVRRRYREGGTRFGELVHSVLASAPLNSSHDDVKEIAEVQGRILSASDDEVVAATETVEQVFQHDLIGRARVAAGRNACRRETPVSAMLSDGTLLEGIVDLAFEEEGRWVVVDYKTDREVAAAGEQRYRRQVAFYASAIARATGKEARGVLVRI